MNSLAKNAANTQSRKYRDFWEASFAAVALNYTAQAWLFPLTNAVSNGLIAIPRSQPANFVALLVSGLLFAIPTIIVGYVLTRLVPRHAIAATATGGMICWLIAWLNWEITVLFSPQAIALNNVGAVLGRPMLQAILLVLTAWVVTRHRNTSPPAKA